jgi:hypothetical protein
MRQGAKDKGSFYFKGHLEGKAAMNKIRRVETTEGRERDLAKSLAAVLAQHAVAIPSDCSVAIFVFSGELATQRTGYVTTLTSEALLTRIKRFIETMTESYPEKVH